MDSDATRTRIDQFFASKKKRTLSPKTAKGGSPSAKGTLENYLVTSQNDSVKRSLALEIDLSAKNANKETLVSSDGSSKNLDRYDSSGAVPREGDGAGNAGGGAVSVDNSDQVEVPEDPKLKQFAMDFLSMYCSGIQASSLPEPIENEHKRSGSPSLLVVEGTSSKKRHYVDDKEMAQSDQQMQSSDKRALGLVSCTRYSQEGERVVDSAIGDAIDKDLLRPQITLRKCNKITDSTVLVNECSTPAALCKSASARETPVSSRGSSFFSPGEAFWNEAIQVVDNLFPQTGKHLIQVAEVTGTGINQDEGVCGEGSLNNNFDVAVGIDASSSKHTELNVALPDTYGEILDIKASPLPVRHFDFSNDDKNVDETMPNHLTSGNGKDDGAVSERAVYTITDHQRALGKNDELTGSEVELHALMHKSYKVPKEAAPLSRAEERKRCSAIANSLINTDSPKRDNGNFLAPSTCGGDNTPSSSMPLEDRLDLSNWLPPVICNIYKRRGIAKLYPWQVDCLHMDGVLQKRNLVYCASTSAGKSFVAEILMLRRVIDSGKIALLVLPYVSICVEKAEHLEVLLEPLGKHVRSYCGNQEA